MKRELTHKLKGRDTRGELPDMWFGSFDGGQGYIGLKAEPFAGDFIETGNLMPLSITHPRGFRILGIEIIEPPQELRPDPEPVEVARLGITLDDDGTRDRLVVAPDPQQRTSGESGEPTPWAVICPEHGQVYLTMNEYDRQMDDPDSLWKCPRCGKSSGWDDLNYEAAQ